MRLSAILLLAPMLSGAQNPYHHYTDAVDAHTSRTQPIVSYTLRVNPEDLSSYAIEMHIRNAPDTLRLAMAAHPEYDDKYWRYLDGLTGAVREDSTLWRANVRNGRADVSYRIKLPTPQEAPRAAWKPYLSPTGGLVGGPHAFMYVIGATLAPSHVTLELPQGWQVATGLAQTASPNSWFAPTVDALMDSPMLVGRFHSWSFAIDGVPHRIIYWSAPNATPFDTVAFASGIQRITQEAINTFGRAPYRDFTFIMQDNAYGGLEHRNSVTLGAPSANLARDMAGSFTELAHEFTHTWNLMRIRPEEYGDVTWKTQVPVKGLWFSEGLTMHYADLFARRAGLHLQDSTRLTHLESILGRYISGQGNSRFSAERISEVEYNSAPGALGDYNASAHTVGEILGNVLDIVIRDATDNRKSMQDVMRLMLDRYSGVRGFNGRDIERTVAEVCVCSVHSLFEANVRGASAIDYARYFALAGLRVSTTHGPVLNRDGTPAIDLRMRMYVPDNGGTLRMMITTPTSSWGRAGFHTTDVVLAINGTPVATWTDARTIVGAARIGDTLRFDARHDGVATHPVVVMSGFDRTVPTISELPNATDKQRRIRDAILLRSL